MNSLKFTMKSSVNSKGVGSRIMSGLFNNIGSFCGCLLILTLSGIVGAICWPYTINTWLVFLGKAPVIVWWQGLLMGYVPWLGQASLPAAVVTWILMLFLA